MTMLGRKLLNLANDEGLSVVEQGLLEQSNDEDDKLSYYLLYFGLVYINIWTVFYVPSFSSFVV